MYCKTIHFAWAGAGAAQIRIIIQRQSTSPEDINYLCTYDLYRPVRNVFYAGEKITRQALEIKTFLGPEMARADTPLVMFLPA